MKAAITAPLLVAAATAAYGAGSSVAVYPSGPMVPENLLLIELRFSSPMKPPLEMEHVRLLDSDGMEIGSAFLDLPLPGADSRRLTILLHPGRVKSGLGANLALGRSLRSGSAVTLAIDHPALAQPVRKTWRVAPFDAASPQPAHWTFESPRRGSRAPMVVRLDAPISACAEALIAIRAPDGQRLPGTARLEDGETSWRFVPARPWRGGRHALVTHRDLEDAAGNRPCAPFEDFNASRALCEQGTARAFHPF